MQIVLTLRVFLVNDLQNPHIKIPIWQDTHVYETQISGVTALQKVYDVYVVYKQGSTGLGCDTRFIEKNECTFGIFVVSIWFAETIGIDTNRASNNHVLYTSYCSENTGNLIKMPWLCMLCKMCDVRVCIVLTIVVALAFIAIIIAIAI